MAQNMVYFGKCSMKRIYVPLLIGEVFHKCQVKLVDSVIQIFYILIYFLFTCSINYWESDVEIPDYNWELSVFACISITFCFMYFEVLLLNV